VHLGKDDAGDPQALVELVRRFHSVLAGHGVGYEKDLGGIEERLQIAELGHEFVVDMETARGVDHQNVAAGLDGLFAGGASQLDRLGFLRRCSASSSKTTSPWPTFAIRSSRCASWDRSNPFWE